jgi:hypothetical protein
MVTFIREWRPDIGTRWWVIVDRRSTPKGHILGIFEDLETAIIYAYRLSDEARSRPIPPGGKSWTPKRVSTKRDDFKG